MNIELCLSCKFYMKTFNEYPCCECKKLPIGAIIYYEPKEEKNMIDCEMCKNAVPETTYNHDSTKCKRCIGGDENGYELKNSREYILDKAKECVCGHREEDYGVPEQNFQLIADLWNDYLGFNCDENAITCKDVAIMMALLKIARIKRGGGSGDSYVDLAGYAACAGELSARTGL